MTRKVWNEDTGGIALINKKLSFCKYLNSKYAECGSDIYLGNNGIATYENIHVGSHVYFDSNYCLQSAHWKS